ncbi:MAG: hypothetical protein QXT43_00310 [Candidatus Micrarchaeaceae archaeon]
MAFQFRLAAFALLGLALLLVCSNYSNAYSTSQLNSLLVRYNVSLALIASLKPVYINYSGIEYIVLYNNTTPYFIVNTSSDSFVLNATSIYQIIRNYTISNALSSINFSKLGTLMSKYQSSSAGPINDCLHETGLSTGLTCTLANNCASCQAVPVCKDVLDNTSGPSGVVGLGIIKFENQYSALNSSYNEFNSLLRSINDTNALLRISGLISTFRNISNISSTLYQNPIFPPANVTPNMLATCINYPTLTSAPWYCSAVGFCEQLTYNASLLGAMQSEINAINSSPLSNEQVYSLAQKAGAMQLSYVYPVLSRQRLAELNSAISSVLGNYSSTVNGAEALLAHINNSTVVNGLVLLEKSYSALQSNYLTENISRAVNATALLLRNLSAAYARLNRTYSSMLSLASDNTAMLIEAQLTNPQQAGLEYLALEQMQLNGKLSQGNLSNITGISSGLESIYAKAKQFSTGAFGLTEIARYAGGAFARPIAFALHMPYANSVAAAPLLGSLLSLIIGIVAILCLAFARSYLLAKHKLVLNKRTAKNWRLLFYAAVLVVIVYVLATYALLAYANAHAPYSAFASAVAGSKYLVVAVNGTPTLNTYSCASSISEKASALGKQPVLASFSNGVCKVGNSTMNVSACMDYYSALNVPIILLSNSTGSGISLYSLYGTVLSYSGNASVMNACYPALLLN